MQIEVGNILEGKVASITKFGAFVDFEDGQTGMVHISEVSNEYVEDISQHLKKGDIVKVKVIGINDDKKISLSIKKATPRPKFVPKQGGGQGFKKDDEYSERRPPNRNQSRPQNQNRSYQRSSPQNDKMSFEDMMKKFQQSSDEKLSDLKKSTNNKQGSAGYSRRGRQ